MKKSTKAKSKSGQIHKVVDEFEKHLQLVKDKYQAMDPDTRKKIVAGIAGVTALMIGSHKVKKAVKKRINKEE